MNVELFNKTAAYGFLSLISSNKFLRMLSLLILINTSLGISLTKRVMMINQTHSELKLTFKALCMNKVAKLSSCAPSRSMKVLARNSSERFRVNGLRALLLLLHLQSLHLLLLLYLLLLKQLGLLCCLYLLLFIELLAISYIFLHHCNNFIMR